MKLVVVLFAIYAVVCVAGRSTLHRRELMNSAHCPNYVGPSHFQKDLQIEVTHLGPVPMDAHSDLMQTLKGYLPGLLYGRAVAHLSVEAGVDIKPEYFKVKNLPGEIKRVELSADKCEVTIDFVVLTSCQNKCVPMGACIELDRDYIAATLGYEDLPYRKGCKAILPENRPRCLGFEVVALGMGDSDAAGMPYTDKEYTSLMITFDAPMFEATNLLESDFYIKNGPPGTAIEKCTAALPGNPRNKSYILTIKRGTSVKPTEHVEVCFNTEGTTKKAHMLYDASNKKMCVTYGMSYKKYDKPTGANVKLLESFPAEAFC